MACRRHSGRLEVLVSEAILLCSSKYANYMRLFFVFLISPLPAPGSLSGLSPLEWAIERPYAQSKIPLLLHNIPYHETFPLLWACLRHTGPLKAKFCFNFGAGSVACPRYSASRLGRTHLVHLLCTQRFELYRSVSEHRFSIKRLPLRCGRKSSTNNIADVDLEREVARLR